MMLTSSKFAISDDRICNDDPLHWILSLIVSRPFCFQGRTPSGWGGSWTTPRRGSTWRRSSRGRSPSSAEVPHSHQVGGDVRRQTRCVALTAESDGGISPNLMCRLIDGGPFAWTNMRAIRWSGQASSIYADYIWSQMLRCKLINLSMSFLEKLRSSTREKKPNEFYLVLWYAPSYFRHQVAGSIFTRGQRIFELPERAPVFISDIRIMSIPWLIESKIESD